MKVLEFKRPCCSSDRSCAVTFDAVISLRKPVVLRRIDAVRCNRLGIVPKYKFRPAPDVALVSHYRSNRGVVYIKVLWKPKGVSEEYVKEMALKALGYIEEEVVP